jgi:hypothetical protein
MRTTSDLTRYDEYEAGNLAAERRAGDWERFGVATEWKRPDVEQGKARLLKFLAATLKNQKTYWQERADGIPHGTDEVSDFDELRAFCRQQAKSYEPLIALVLSAAERHEQLMEECTR